jgi:hypothetical protein
MHAAVKGESHQALEWVRQTQAQDADDPTSWLVLWAAAIAHGNEHDFEAAARRLCLALEAALADGWAGYVAWCLPIGAVILARQGEPARAAELLALASTHRASLAGWLAHWAPSAQLADRLRQLLGPEGFQRAWERGRALDLQAAAREWMKLSAG